MAACCYLSLTKIERSTFAIAIRHFTIDSVIQKLYEHPTTVGMGDGSVDSGL